MSSSTFPERLTKVDELTLEDHSFLQPDDDCYFLGEYTARAGYTFSATNNLVLNFKKSMDRCGTPEWRYKAQAIQQAAVAFRAALQDAALDSWTFVPIPPSKAKGDPLYDDRLTRMLHKLRLQPPVDVRELIWQTESTEAVHDSDARPSPDEIELRYTIDEACALRPTIQIALVDDVLTTGAHFRAAKSILVRRFPDTKVIGLFIARSPWNL